MSIVTNSKFPCGSEKNLREIIVVPGQYSWINTGSYERDLFDQRMIGMSAMCTKVNYQVHEDGNTVTMKCVIPGDRKIPLFGSEFRLSELWENAYQGIPRWFPIPGQTMFVFGDKNVMKKPKWRKGKDTEGRVVECEAKLSDDRKVMMVSAKTERNEVIEQSYRL